MVPFYVCKYELHCFPSLVQFYLTVVYYEMHNKVHEVAAVAKTHTYIKADFVLKDFIEL